MVTCAQQIDARARGDSFEMYACMASGHAQFSGHVVGPSFKQYYGLILLSCGLPQSPRSPSTQDRTALNKWTSGGKQFVQNNEQTQDVPRRNILLLGKGPSAIRNIMFISLLHFKLVLQWRLCLGHSELLIRFLFCLLVLVLEKDRCQKLTVFLSVGLGKVACGVGTLLEPRLISQGQERIVWRSSIHPSTE